MLLLANINSSGTTLSSFNYTYNPVGNRTQVVEVDGSVVTWSYDPAYQLTHEQRSGSTSYNITYQYDAVGNRLVLDNGGALTTSTYNAANELSTSQASAGVTTYTFDGNGNLLTTLAPGNQLTTSTWDGENRLTQVALPSAIVDIFTYNADGQRVQKQDSSGTTKHVWDGQSILLETTVSNVLVVVYTLQSPVYGGLISQSRSGTDSFYLFDMLGSTRELVSNTSSVAASYVYDSFGDTLVTSGTTTNWFQYLGERGSYLDVDLATNLLGARVYYPAAARFLSRDLLAAASENANAYLLAQNNPLGIYSPPRNPRLPGGVPGCPPWWNSDRQCCIYPQPPGGLISAWLCDVCQPPSGKRNPGKLFACLYFAYLLFAKGCAAPIYIGALTMTLACKQINDCYKQFG